MTLRQFFQTVFILYMFCILACTETDNGNQTKENDSAGDDDTDTLEVAPERLALTLVQSCDDAWDIVKEKTVRDMRHRIETYRDEVLDLKNMSETECADLFDYSDADADADTDSDSDADSDAEGDADEFSTTNNQVAGVEEADFMKNDGRYIYILADGGFQIVEAWPAADSRIISQTPIEGTPKKLFIYDGKAVVYSATSPVAGTDANFRMAQNVGTEECTYGYDCDFVGDGRKMKITILDIADLSAPQLLRETYTDSSWLNARRIENAVYTVAVFPALNLHVDDLEYTPDGIPADKCGNDIDSSEEEIIAAYEALIEENEARISDFNFSGQMPTITDKQYEAGKPVGEHTEQMNCRNLYISSTMDGGNIITALGLDMDTMGEYTTTSVFSRPGAVYADGDSLYLAMRHYMSDLDYWFYETTEGITEATTIHKFKLSSATAAVSYQGSGMVKGRVLNQFSMDEYEDHLRIATTTGRLGAANTHSTLSVLSVDDGNLVLTGQVDDIAATEDIRSVRFNQDTGYIVTFRQTDPLFVLDLSHPDAPRVRGELKIPGYSTYMHMIDDAHILSIGLDEWSQNVQLQILDVSDIANPALLHKEVISSDVSASAAVTDHLAFNYFKSLNQLAIPMVVCGQSSVNSTPEASMSFNGLMVYDISVADGFNYVGGIPYEAATVDDGAADICRYWRSTGKSSVKRSVFMDDFVYAIASDQISVSNLADLEHPVSRIDPAMSDN